MMLGQLTQELVECQSDQNKQWAYYTINFFMWQVFPTTKYIVVASNVKK
jgi:hypothetical protein